MEGLTMTTTHNHISLEAQMPDSIELSAADKAAYCAHAYLAVCKARDCILYVDRVLDLELNLEHNRIYVDMINLRHRMFEIMKDLKNLQNEFSKEELEG